MQVNVTITSLMCSGRHECEYLCAHSAPCDGTLSDSLVRNILSLITQTAFQYDRTLLDNDIL